MRIKGDWKILEVDKASEVEQKVRDEFAKNTYSHSIVFDAPKGAYKLYDPLLLRLGGKVFASYVCTTEEKKNSDTVRVTCGELQTVYPFERRL